MSEKNHVIDLNDYKRKKHGLDRPIFDAPATIQVGDPNQPDTLVKYAVICNFVRYNRQFMALEREDTQEDRYVIVEGIVEDGTLAKVDPISEEEYPAIEALFQKVFAKVIGKSSENKSTLKLAFRRY
ncbi:hypothetical protein NC661_06290 [Aquibacillus koreensis]|uniref:Uncharacterized protein n=1 Tax=Aquibacillus koreensis TaxID=279446 RepID=A0A9X4AJ55_9BACI|nr:hypothetical protein [Aquibacillus koreensis]MCT2536639.1 hypothetical protein [Aquibacillus koreensis]MDC3419978.1 hypothetical protein [Aquibacillus koreensis]